MLTKKTPWVKALNILRFKSYVILKSRGSKTQELKKGLLWLLGLWSFVAIFLNNKKKSFSFQSSGPFSPEWTNLCYCRYILSTQKEGTALWWRWLSLRRRSTHTMTGSRVRWLTLVRGTYCGNPLHDQQNLSSGNGMPRAERVSRAVPWMCFLNVWVKENVLGSVGGSQKGQGDHFISKTSNFRSGLVVPLCFSFMSKI